MLNSQSKRILSGEQAEAFLQTLKQRFGKHMDRHSQHSWKLVSERLLSHPALLWSVYEMEKTGGEPDVVGNPGTNGECRFLDCSAESPAGRRSLCYDDEALEARKENKPGGSCLGMAAQLGISLLDEQEYRLLQSFGKFDMKTSSWIKTPADIREAGGALFADYRYGHVFVYHNGAPSYYAARGWRGVVVV